MKTVITIVAAAMLLVGSTVPAQAAGGFVQPRDISKCCVA
ncbi:MAG: hypothetical protein RL672_423 [Actinomycetota bacterium]